MSALDQVLNKPSPAVKQAITDYGAMQAAADNSPDQKALKEAADEATKGNTEAAADIKANAAKRDQLLSDDKPAPAPPKLKDVPAPPPEQAVSDPLKVFQQFIPVLASLGSAFVKNGSVTSLNAATAAMNAMKANDTAAMEKAHQQWMDSMEYTLKQNAQETEQYRAALDEKQLSMTDRAAKLAALASASGDDLTLNTLASGRFSTLHTILDTRDKAADRLNAVYNQAVDHQEKQQQLKIEASQRAEQERHDRAEEMAAIEREPLANQVYHAKLQAGATQEEAIKAAGEASASVNVSKASATEKGIRQELEKSPLGKAYGQLDQFGRVINDARAKIDSGQPLSAIEQQGVMDAYQKILTGGNAIRGFQVRMATDHAGIADKANVLLAQLGKGGPMSQRMLKDIVDVTDAYADGMSKEYQTAVDRGVKQAQDLGLPGESVVPFDFNPTAAAAKLDAPTLLQHAKEAIAQGAPKAEVVKRLKDMGVPTDGL